MANNNNNNNNGDNDSGKPRRTKQRGPRGTNSSTTSGATIQSAKHPQGSEHGHSAVAKPRAAPVMPNDPVPTLMALMNAVNAIREKNTQLAENTGRALTNIERRFQAIASDKNLKAASITSFSPERILASMGKEIPCDTVEKTIEMMMDVMYGNGEHPVRVGVRGLSKFLKNQTSTIFKIPAGGSDGYRLGDAIAVAFPVHAAHRGACIIALHADGTWDVLAYAKPNRDLQRTGATLIALYSALSLSAPSAITGTNVAVTAQLFLALGNFACAPMMILPTNPGPLSQDGSAHARTIGPEEHSIHQFNATEAIEAVSTYSAYDTINSDIARAVQPSVQSYENTSTYASPSRPYIVAATGNSADAAKATGFTPAVQAAFGANLLLPADTNVSLWDWSSNNDYLRHMVQGDCEFNMSLTATPDAGGSHTLYVYVLLTYDTGAGTTQTFQETCSLSAGVGEVNTMNLYFNTRGPSRARSYDGYLLKNINVTIRSLTYASNLVCTEIAFPKICVKFLDVPSTTRYVVGIFNNVNPGNSIAVDQKAQVEALVDPVAEDSKYLEVPNVQPYFPDILPGILRVHTQLARSDKHDNSLSASSFGRTFKKILKAGGRVGIRGLKGAAGALLSGGDPVQGALSGMTSSSFGAGPDHFDAVRDLQRDFFDPAAADAQPVFNRLMQPRQPQNPFNRPRRDRDVNVRRVHLPNLNQEVQIRAPNPAIGAPPRNDLVVDYEIVHDDAPLVDHQVFRHLDEAQVDDFPGLDDPDMPDLEQPQELDALQEAMLRLGQPFAASDFNQSSSQDDLGAPTAFIGLNKAKADDIDHSFGAGKSALARLATQLASIAGADMVLDSIVALRDKLIENHIDFRRHHAAPKTIVFASAPIGPAPKYYFPAVRGDAWVISPVVRAACSDLELNCVFPRGEFGSPAREITGRSNTGSILLANLAHLGFPVVPEGNFSFEVTGVTVEKDASGAVSTVRFIMLPVDHANEKLYASKAADMPLTGLFREGFYRYGQLMNFNPTYLFPSKSVTANATRVALDPPFPRDAVGYQIVVSRSPK